VSGERTSPAGKYVNDAVFLGSLILDVYLTAANDLPLTRHSTQNPHVTRLLKKGLKVNVLG
jgi:hypothetical protein